MDSSRVCLLPAHTRGQQGKAAGVGITKSRESLPRAMYARAGLSNRFCPSVVVVVVVCHKIF